MPTDLLAKKPVDLLARQDVLPEPAQADAEFSFGEMVSNVPSSAAQFGKDIIYPFRHPVETAKGMGNLAMGLGQKLIPGEQEEEQYADQMGQFIADRYGSWENFKQTLMKDPVGVLADASTVITGVGGAVRAGGRVAGTTGKLGRAVQATGAALDPVNLALKTGKKTVGALTPKRVPAKLYDSAAKFSTTFDQAKRDALVQTALENRLMPTVRGVDKLSNMITDINAGIDDMIRVATESGKKIPKDAVYRHLKQVRQRMGGAKLEGGSDLRKIDDVARQFDEHMKRLGKESLTPEELQAFKQDAYKKINFERSQAKADLAKEESFKAMARAAKESIEEVAPGIGAENQRLGRLLELQDPLQRSASRIGNRNLISINTPLNVGAGAAAGSVPGTVAGALASILEFPQTKARLAISLSDAQRMSLVDALMSSNIPRTATRQALFQAGRAEQELNR